MISSTSAVRTKSRTPNRESDERGRIYTSLLRLFTWLEENDYRGYDTFDGLSAKFPRLLTFENPLLLIALQQTVRRFPINLRPLFGIRPEHSSKGMAFLARGFLRLAAITNDTLWDEKARFCLQWLLDDRLPGYSGACWGNHFDYQSRNGSIPKGMPTVVWTSLIGHAFLDAYLHFSDDQYLKVAMSICDHILRDLRTQPSPQGLCINYTPGRDAWVHNANTLGAAFLARAYAYSQDVRCKTLAQEALLYTAQHQHPSGAWFYGEKSNLHWIDNFHTAYVLDCFKYYAESTGDDRYEPTLNRGYNFWKSNFFLPDGAPKYYDRKALPLDIQCSSQAIDTLVFFANRDSEALPLALTVANWTIANMQAKSGYFYYRRYSRWLVNKTPTLHWGQATMFCALAGLYGSLIPGDSREEKSSHYR